MIIDGKKIAAKILEGAKSAITKSYRELALVLVGGDAGSLKFLELKQKAAGKVGIDAKLYKYSEEITTEKLVEEITFLAESEDVGGIIVELPLPSHIISERVLDAVPVSKDPDMLSGAAQNLFYSGKSEIMPPSIRAVQEIIENIGFNVREKNCAVFGQGLLVGKPVAHWLSFIGAKVSVIDEFTPEPRKVSSKADLIVSGVGKPGLITADMVKDGAVVIDFGYAKAGEEMKGDVDYDNVSKKASFITPVPGGVGPIVVAAVIENTVKLIK
ncbi:MAG: methylenetetrahydrofolate dehydrogenase (NADP+) / methenyltetrahydrofolate cyclohydrolase [Parcubacteria group bacterium Licking1014_17]|nr:MAG: methylenetetrahydrofolate dehydrogenase (NADP+) / methenyltetrahydrofolate cyclohydrolase [Parcubacteria group bacterium Licking1014_17]